MVGTGNGTGTERFPKPRIRKGKGKLYLTRPGNGKETLYTKFGNVDITGKKHGGTMQKFMKVQ